MSFAKSWQDKGCSSQAETSRVKNILTKDFDWKVKFDILVVSITQSVGGRKKISCKCILQEKIHGEINELKKNHAYNK